MVRQYRCAGSGNQDEVSRTALDRAMTIRAQLMRENAAGWRQSEGYALCHRAWHGTPRLGSEPGFPRMVGPGWTRLGPARGMQALGGDGTQLETKQWPKQLSAYMEVTVKTDGSRQKLDMVDRHERRYACLRPKMGEHRFASTSDNPNDVLRTLDWRSTSNKTGSRKCKHCELEPQGQSIGGFGEQRCAAGWDGGK